MSKKIDLRQSKLKELLIEQLKRTPIIQLACEKITISRATFYRWCEKDKKFADAVAEAIKEGGNLVSDLAESQLMSAIRDGNLSAVVFWLKTHKTEYNSKLEISGKIKAELETFTPEQEELIKKALDYSLLDEDEVSNKLI
ncbi:MAG: phBC6A51 family helix-turn-helix protein [Candidatus Parcubacteria bacterium]|nr:phBC6A51 family helix-turn-helix protein [Candidatus Parcubacteria bacterium]